MREYFEMFGGKMSVEMGYTGETYLFYLKSVVERYDQKPEAPMVINRVPIHLSYSTVECAPGGEPRIDRWAPRRADCAWGTPLDSSTRAWDVLRQALLDKAKEYMADTALLRSVRRNALVERINGLTADLLDKQAEAVLAQDTLDEARQDLLDFDNNEGGA